MKGTNGKVECPSCGEVFGNMSMSGMKQIMLKISTNSKEHYASSCPMTVAEMRKIFNFVRNVDEFLKEAENGKIKVADLKDLRTKLTKRSD